MSHRVDLTSQSPHMPQAEGAPLTSRHVPEADTADFSQAKSPPPGVLGAAAAARAEEEASGQKTLAGKEVLNRPVFLSKMLRFVQQRGLKRTAELATVNQGFRDTIENHSASRLNSLALKEPERLVGLAEKAQKHTDLAQIAVKAVGHNADIIFQNKDSYHVRYALSAALENKWDDPKVSQAIARVFLNSAPDTEIRSKAFAYLKKFGSGDPKTLSIIAEGLVNPESAIRDSSADLLKAQHPYPDWTTPVSAELSRQIAAHALNTEDYHVQKLNLSLLEKLKPTDPETLQLVAKAFVKPLTASVRANGLPYPKYIDFRSDVDVDAGDVERFLQGGIARYSNTAQRSFNILRFAGDKLTPEVFEIILEKGLKAENPEIRQNTADLLRRLGSAAKPAERTLSEYLSTGSPEVKRIALEVLAGLGSESRETYDKVSGILRGSDEALKPLAGAIIKEFHERQIRALGTAEQVARKAIQEKEGAESLVKQEKARQQLAAEEMLARSHISSDMYKEFAGDLYELNTKSREERRNMQLKADEAAAAAAPKSLWSRLFGGSSS